MPSVSEAESFHLLSFFYLQSSVQQITSPSLSSVFKFMSLSVLRLPQRDTVETCFIGTSLIVAVGFAVDFNLITFA